MSALITLKNVQKSYFAGNQTVTVLNDINLTIAPGEMVAIVGASGSGKSTLLNILGCLDRPTQGAYWLKDKETGQLGPDEQAELRREHFGFIFQRYNLLSDLTAQGNVEIPALYADVSRSMRQTQAQHLLTELGLADRLKYRPNQLSGGQQQRVSIARALINGGQIILADEPTGALDTQTGQRVLEILKDLHRAGHTIILVTHDKNVAHHASRIVQMSDGVIISDAPNPAYLSPPTIASCADAALLEVKAYQEKPKALKKRRWSILFERSLEALYMAGLAMKAHKLRTFLTMLGIIIGISAVVCVVALGQGARQRILNDISGMGTDTMDIFSGKGFGDERARAIRTLVPADAQAIATQSYVDSVTPTVGIAVSLRYRNISVNTTVQGVGEQYFRVHGLEISQGQFFNRASVQDQAQEIVIDDKTRQTLFGEHTSPIGQVVFMRDVPGRIIGVTKKKSLGFSNPESLNIWIPYTTAMTRLLGQPYIGSITVRIKESVSLDLAEDAITKLLTQRHQIKDFFIFNTAVIRQTIEKTTMTLALLISMIALISLIVGGIGVMNIMLVSVTERTHEIGIRMAVGARRSDILRQFLIEAVLVCLIGGTLGIIVSLLIGGGVTHLTHGSFPMNISPLAMAIAFIFSTLIGVVFGFLPARQAARLDPVEALSRD